MVACWSTPRGTTGDHGAIMGGRGELTDRASAELAPLLPANGRRDQQWGDHRTVINGILWKLRTGAPWRDRPGRYGPWHTCYARFVRPGGRMAPGSDCWLACRPNP